MRFCSSRRATSKRLCSISLMALSNSTLSGCCVSLVMGLEYFLRRMPQPPSSTATANTTAVERIAFRTIITQSPQADLTCDLDSLRRNLTHLKYRGLRVRTVKDRRPCDDPVTPRTHHFRQILLVHAAIDFDGQR